MKKILILLGLLTATAVYGQNFKPQSFLNDGIVKLVITNTIGATNLNPFSIVNTNKAGLIFTNGSGNAVTVVAGSNDTFNVFKDVSLWSDRDGRWYSEFIVITNGTTGAIDTSKSLGQTPFNLSYVLNGGANFTNYAKFSVIPIYGGTYEATDETFNFDTVIGNGTTFISGKTNLPVWRWPGASGLRLKYAAQTNGQAAACQFVIWELNINGYKP